jgi:hypothetical protein
MQANRRVYSLGAVGPLLLNRLLRTRRAIYRCRRTGSMAIFVMPVVLR